MRVIRSYRALLPRVAERRTRPPGRRPGPASVHGTLERDALAVDAGLKQLPGTRRCGGGATRAGTNLTTRVRRSSRKTLRMHVTLPVARWEARSGGGRGGFQLPGNPSLTERMLQRQGGGAVAVIADTDVSPTVQNDQLTVGWADAMFPATVPTFGSAQPLRRMGEILNAGKAYMASLAPASSH